VVYRKPIYAKRSMSFRPHPMQASPLTEVRVRGTSLTSIRVKMQRDGITRTRGEIQCGSSDAVSLYFLAYVILIFDSPSIL